ncbi:MAG: hypothetical protein CSA64_05355, partial [Arachnia propionica]
MRAVKIVGVLAAVLAVIGIGMRIAGEIRMLKLGLELWATPVVAGAILMIAALFYEWRSRRVQKAIADALERSQVEARET